MSAKFRIHKLDGAQPWPWRLEYPDGFSDALDCVLFSSFEHAVAAFIEQQQWQCPTCLAGAVFDTSWGWECAACGSYDVAVGCARP